MKQVLKATAFLASLTLGVLLQEAAAWAQRPEVVEAIELFDDLRFDRARGAFELALSLEGNRAEDLSTISLYLGMLAGGVNDEAAAEAHFRRALAVDPLIELPPGQPPKITRPFAAARAFWGERRLRVTHERPVSWSGGEPATLRFEVTDDLMSLVTGARLFLESEGSERSFRQDGPGPYLFPIPEELVEPGRVLRYRVEVLGVASSILLTLDDEDLAVPVVGEDGEVPEVPEVATPVHRRWWFWTTLGLVVSSVVVGLVLGLTLQQEEGLDFGRPTYTR